ncbi:MAG: hypothetical protein AcusKO_29730 [Acuticoccus sp.]
MRDNISSPMAGTRVVWLNALVVTSFIGLMVLTSEAIVAFVGGSLFHSVLLGTLVAAVMALPTLGWLLVSVLRTAVAAEREIATVDAPGAG